MSAPTTLSLMVVPNSADVEAMPTILVDHGGVWRDMSSTGHKMPPVINKVNENLQGIANLIGNKPVSANHPAISSMFNDFFQLIVPPKAADLLAKTLQAADLNETPVLRIHTQSSNEWIPWELLRDGTDLLGLRFKIARLPIVAHELGVANNQPHQVKNISSFLGRDVLDDVQRESWESTFTGLLNSQAVAQLFPPEGDKDNFPDLQRVSENYESADILHVTCHGMKDNQERVYLTLDHRSTPAASILYNITTSVLNDFVFNTRPLVFGNGCTSVGAVGGNQATGGLMPPGIGASFFSRGALNFIGTFAPVTKDMALKFARKFYENLLGDHNGQPGLPIAEALWATKKHFQQANATDPSYLFYCLYGPPETTYQA